MPDFGPRWIDPRPLDKGGQAHTFLVRDAGGDLSSDYVAKVLNSAREDRLQRFLQEINVTKSFKDCPYVVQSIDCGTTARSRFPFFVMPYYKLGTLEKRHDTLGTPLDRLRLFLFICKGVEYAHSLGLIHRDLKPANVFMAGEQHPVVGDFGLCYRSEEEAEGRFTQTSEAVGARKYMPPEWREGRADDLGPTGDIYSLGKILYWMFCGRVYDGHEDDHVKDHPILKTNSVLENLVPQGPDRWVLARAVAQELVSECVMKNASARVKSAAKLVEKVQAAIDRIEIGGRVLDFNLPKACIFCGKGTYQWMPNTPFPTRDKRKNKDNQYLMGLSGAVKMLLGFGNQSATQIPVALICYVCGNVQYFRLDLTYDKTGDSWNP